MNKLIVAFVGLLLISQNLVAQTSRPTLVVPTGHNDPITKVTFSGDSHLLLSASSTNEVILWNVVDGGIIRKFTTSANVTDVYFSDSDSLVFAATANGDLYQWRIKGLFEEKIHEIHHEAINQIEILGGKLISLSSDTTVRFWGPNFKQAIVYPTELPMNVMAIDPTGELLALSDRSGNLMLLNANTGEVEFSGPLLEGNITSMVFNAGADILYAVNSSGQLFKIALSPLTVEGITQLPVTSIRKMVLVGNQLFMAVRGNDKNIIVQDLNGGEAKELSSIMTGFPKSEKSILGIYGLALSKDNLLAVPHPDGRIRIFDLLRKTQVQTLRGYSNSITDISLADGVLYYASDLTLNVNDFSGLRPAYHNTFQAEIVQFVKRAETTLVILKDGSMVTMDGQVIIHTWKPKSNFSNREVALSPDGQKLVYHISEDRIAIDKIGGERLYSVKVKDGRQLKSTYRGWLVYSENNLINMYSWSRKKRVFELKVGKVLDLDVNTSGTWATVIEQLDERYLVQYNLLNGKLTARNGIADSIRVDRVYQALNPENVYTISRSIGRYNAKNDFTIRRWNINERYLERTYTGHSGFVNDLELQADGFFSASVDGTIRYWSKDKSEAEMTFIPLNDTEWVALNPYGLFDASRKAFNKLHFMFQNTEISLQQLKDAFYEPRLTEKLLFYPERDFSLIAESSLFNLFPKIELVEKEPGLLRAKLTDQGGGLGELILSLNNKVLPNKGVLIPSDSAGNEYIIDLRNHPMVKPGKLNKLIFEAYNKRGYHIKNTRKYYFLSDTPKTQSIVEKKLFIISVGISDYKGEAIDLDFAAKDAADITDILEAGGQNQYGSDYTEIIRLHTFQGLKEKWPFKRNIKEAFEYVSENAGLNDALVVYLAGHGLNVPDSKDFHFLTAEAELPFVKPDDNLLDFTLSSSEIGSWLANIKAGKQFLIVDACHSGKILSDALYSGSFNSKDIRALDQIKDQSGVYILASSESDALSFESNHLEQGLLTYSLLFGFKGGALIENQYLDVIDLMQFARNKVPDLAGDLGERQVPVLQMPQDAESFIIGSLSSSQRNSIQLNSPKPIVISTNFQNENTYHDEMHISLKFDEELKRLRNTSNNGFLFIERGGVFDDAFSINGRYSFSMGQYTISYSVFHGDEELYRASVSGNQIDELVKQIVNTTINDYILAHKKSDDTKN